MKTKKPSKRMRLNKKTIVNLNYDAMKRALGGACPCCGCNPCCCCPDTWGECETRLEDTCGCPPTVTGCPTQTQWTNCNKCGA